MAANNKKKIMHTLDEIEDDEDYDYYLEIGEIDNGATKRIEIKKTLVEPIVETITSKEGIRYLFQLPGIREDTLTVNSKNGKLDISASSLNIDYVKTLRLPEDADASKRRVVYKNYSLEIFVPVK